MSRDVLKVTRHELYELVWSKPMTELASDFGLSDVGLAKRCRSLGVPVPGRGYWARVAAGQTPRRTPLPKPTDNSSTEFGAPPPEQPSEEAIESALSEEERAFESRLASIDISQSTDLMAAHPVIQRKAREMKLRKASEFTWRRSSDRSGPTLQVDVSDSQRERALLLADNILQSASTLGWSVSSPVKPEETTAFLTVEGERIGFRIDERRRQIDHVLTPEELERKRRKQLYASPRWDYEWSGELRLHLVEPGDARYAIGTWKDGKRRVLEEQAGDILRGFFRRAQELKRRRAEQERDEAERRRQQELEWQRSKRRDTQLKLIRTLELQAGAWLRARTLRAYLRAARRVLGEQSIHAKVDEQTVDFLSWAETYVNQLDPLHREPRNRDLERTSHAWRSDTELKEELSRLLGHEGQQSWKLSDFLKSS